MSDTTQVSVTQLNSVINAVNNISRNVVALQGQTNHLANNVATVNNNVGIVNQNLLTLTKEFRIMVKEQRMAAALQRAMTELIRVRQELEQKFGNYKIVRDNMLGVLQATDKQLVTQSTISRVSEELMLSTPGYWLAPLLVAVSAWIGNQPELAERAIKEAIKRDDEKTSLTMALICRRNSRFDTCFEWLSRYFSMQSAKKMTNSIVTCIEAYVSNVFGPDKDGICAGYLNKWMKELVENNTNFKDEQVKFWRNYYQSLCANVNEKYPTLSKVATNFAPMGACVERINASAPIKNYFTRIIDAPVNTEEMIKRIDDYLLTLVTNYDKVEASLRDEEELLQEIKNQKGDEDKATAIVNARKAVARRFDAPVDLAARLTETITKNDEKNPGTRKTAFAFLYDYIKEGYDAFITEKAPEFPEKANLAIDTWRGTVATADEKPALTKSYEAKLTADKEAALAAVTDKKFKTMLGVAVGAGVIGVIGLFTTPVLAVLGIGGAAVGAFMAVKEKKAIKAQKENIENTYAAKIKAGKVTLSNAVDQWVDVKSTVDSFYALADNKVLGLKEGK